jgi:hypothetical protein
MLTDFIVEPVAALPGASVRFSFTLSNTRDGAASATNYEVWLSTDPVLDDADRLLGEVDLSPVAGFESRVEGRRFDVPADLVTGGTFYVLLVLDPDNRIVEFSDRNNTIATELVVAPRCSPDLAEPNNFSFEAFAAEDAEGEPLTLCGDVDWYVFTPTRNSTISASITFTHATGDLDLYAYRDPPRRPRRHQRHHHRQRIHHPRRHPRPANLVLRRILLRRRERLYADYRVGIGRAAG